MNIQCPTCRFDAYSCQELNQPCQCNSIRYHIIVIQHQTNKHPVSHLHQPPRLSLLQKSAGLFLSLLLLQPIIKTADVTPTDTPSAGPCELSLVVECWRQLAEALPYTKGYNCKLLVDETI